MRANRTCCVAISTLGLLTAACGITASVVPTLLPSPVFTTIFVVLAIAIAAALLLALSQSSGEQTPSQSGFSPEHLQLKIELETLRHLHTELLEDKAFLQFMRADQDHERQLLALDLHDLSLPNLTSALFHLETLNQRLDSAGETLDGTIDLVRDSLYQTRRVMNCLSPSLVQDEGVVASMQRLADRLEASADSVIFHHDVEFDRLTPLCECALIQLVREVLDQTRRNRFAQNIEMELIQENDLLRLSISDDGHGDLVDSPRIQQCLEILSGHPVPPHQSASGHVMRVDFSVTDLTQSDTIKEKSRAFS